MLTKRDGVAEVRFTDTGIALFGAIRSASCSSLSIELITAPRRAGIVKSGSEAEVFYAHGGTLFVSVSSVQSITESTVELALVHGPRPTPRRTVRRARCDVPVQYRAIRADGRTGAWMECAAEDISPGGIGLVFPEGVEVPRRVELRFFLPLLAAAPAEHRRLSTVDDLAATDPHPYKATGRIVHCRPTTYGRTRAGTAFSVISSSDRGRLAKFVETVALHAA